MPVKSQDYSNVCVISVTGDFTGGELDSARKCFEQRIESRRVVDYVIDFENSSFIDSDGLEQLLWMKRKCEDLTGQVKLVGLDENMKRILYVTRLGVRFECHDDLAAALKTM